MMIFKVNLNLNFVIIRMTQIDKLYDNLMELGTQRRKRLEETCQAYKLVREAQELSNWIRTKEVHATIQDVSDDLEQVEVMQKKFDDFKADLKANEVRLAEMNEIAMQLVSLGQTEAAMKIQAQLEDLNQKWTKLQEVCLSGQLWEFQLTVKTFYTRSMRNKLR